MGKSNLRFLAFSLLGFVMVLTACGGGGGGGSSSGGGAGTTYTLTVNKNGSGTVTSSPAGIDCAQDCTESFNEGTQVTLTAAAAAGYSFTSWVGCDSTTGSSCVVAMNQDKTVTANFVASYWAGAKQLGTTDYDEEGDGIAVDASGNVYVAGYTEGGLDGNISAGLADVFLVKYNSVGVKQWTRQLGTALNDYGEAVAVDASGNVYVAGSTEGGLDGNISAGLADIFLVKYDSAGVKQWTRQLGTTLTDIGEGIAVDASGNVYVTGYTDGSLDGNITAGGNDIFLVKYDSAGVKQWTVQLGSTSNDYGEGVAVDASGNVYVTGWTEGGLDGNINVGMADIFLVKYNSAGVKQWTVQLGSTLNDISEGLAVDASGNVYVTGYTDGGLDGNNSAGNTDIFLVKYDSSGVKQWTRQLGTTDFEEGSGVAVDASGNVYVTGWTNGGLDGYISEGMADIFLVKYDSLGVKQWTRQLGTTSNDTGSGLAVDASGNVYAAGYTQGGLDGNISAGNKDIFVLKYDSNGVKQ